MICQEVLGVLARVLMGILCASNLIADTTILLGR
jgi:hypothetical protein